MDELVLTRVADFCCLSDAQKLFADGATSAYIQNRSARIVTKSIRNFAGLVSAVKVTFETCERQLEKTGVKFFWPRAYFCTYPHPYYKNWHRPISEWKRRVLEPYMTPDEATVEFTRLDLFRLQKQMRSCDILVIGW
jgi:hypothetical protein